MVNITDAVGTTAKMAYSITSAFTMWTALIVLTNCGAPVAVVLSGSMEPVLHRGDLIFCTNESTPVQVNEVVMFTVPGRAVPIVHRVIAVNKCKTTGELSYLTKGDNNAVADDRFLYAPGQRFVKHKDVIGRVKGTLPQLGMARLWLEDIPYGMHMAVGLSMLLGSKDYVVYLGYVLEAAVAAFVFRTWFEGRKSAL